jgi:hypothetical protein
MMSGSQVGDLATVNTTGDRTRGKHNPRVRLSAHAYLECTALHVSYACRQVSGQRIVMLVRQDTVHTMRGALFLTKRGSSLKGNTETNTTLGGCPWHDAEILLEYAGRLQQWVRDPGQLCVRLEWNRAERRQ